MSYLKEMEIDRMNNEKPKYEIYIMQADGPDDFVWELWHETDNYDTALACVKFLGKKGNGVKMFDPFVGKYYNENLKEVSQ